MCRHGRAGAGCPPGAASPHNCRRTWTWRLVLLAQLWMGSGGSGNCSGSDGGDFAVRVGGAAHGDTADAASVDDEGLPALHGHDVLHSGCESDGEQVVVAADV